MRILHTIPGRNWGGMEFRVLEQMAWLAARGHPTWLATPKNGESFKRASAQGLSVIDIDFDQPWSFSLIRQLRALLVDLKIDVADAHVTRDAKALIACLDRVAVVRSRHITQRLKPGLLRGMQWRYGADQVIAVADCIRAALVTDGLADPWRTHVVGEWADETFFQPTQETIRQRIRREWGCADNETAIVTVSMLRPDKGLEFAVQALPHLLGEGIAARLVIIGGATGEGVAYEARLKAEAARLNVETHVVFAGYSENVAHSLMAADLVCVPSVANEAQSRIVPQAFASGRAVVATRVGGLPELVSDAKTGLLVPPHDPFSLAKALSKLARDKAQASILAAEAKLLAEAQLRMDGRMTATLGVYEKALERAASRSYLRLKR
jgi:glycosyltransferase involved in cell wall biosynthesis